MIKHLSVPLLGLTLVSAILSSHASAAEKYSHDVNVIEELRVRDGLPNFFKKVENHEPVNVVYLGGSITHADGWRPKTFKWLESQFPESKFTHTDAAVPGTGADFAACRLAEDALSHKPDLIFVEYRVNGGGGVEARAIEGIVRQIWEANPETDICLVYTVAKWMLKGMEDGGQQFSFGKIMEKTANVYGIPSIDLAPEVLARKKSGALIFQGPKPIEGKLVFSKDGVHPGDAGHDLYKEIIARSITAMNDKGTASPHSLPAPLQKQYLTNATLVPISKATPTGNWQPVDKATDSVWLSNEFRTGKMLGTAIKTREIGATITLDWTGTRLGFTTIPQGNEMVVTASTDGSEPKSIVFNQDRDILFASFSSLPELPQGEHRTTLTISKLPENTDFYAGQFLLLRDPEQTK